MFKKNIVLVQLGLVVFLFTGCSVTSEPIYSASKTANKIPEIKYLELLTTQNTQKKEFTLIQKATNITPDEDNYVNTSSINIDLKKFPSIVIALPVEKNFIIDDKDLLDKSNAFKTEGYINKAEPNVEKELMRFGFSVIDRSKFEAKLRTLRDTTKYSKDQFITQSRINNEKIEYFKKLKENGKISEEEYFKKLSDADLDSKKREEGEKEIIDMSELIRAAQSEGVKADYILQLNKIVEYSAYATTINLKGQTEVEKYMSENLDLEYGKEINNIPTNFPVDVYRVVFGAKLINVQSGRVEWVGTHELNSLDIENITASFNIVRKDISTPNINKEIQSKYDYASELYQSAKNTEKQLISLYKTASLERKYKDKKIQSISEKTLLDNIKRTEQSLAQKIRKINEANNNSLNITQDIEFSYAVSELIVSPDFNIDKSTLDRKKEKDTQKHRQKLLNKTIRSLLNTIIATR